MLLSKRSMYWTLNKNKSVFDVFLRLHKCYGSKMVIGARYIFSTKKPRVGLKLPRCIYWWISGDTRRRSDREHCQLHQIVGMGVKSFILQF